ncbi:MAG: hypothetical protein A2Y38_06010 [Spirochaetes bacterium GWB1_59_5]|nr:MAG: hypothetical protein A2Y38_06010 [Spirochaetes bacterium GWB1_59_5]
MVLDDLADYISSGGVATTTYRGWMPEKPDEAIQLVETGGMAPVPQMSGTTGVVVEERPSVQVVRRSPSYQRARVEMNVIFGLLQGLGGRTINGTDYKWVEAIQSPFVLGQDESGRTLMACNFRVFKALSTSTST